MSTGMKQGKGVEPFFISIILSNIPSSSISSVSFIPLFQISFHFHSSPISASFLLVFFYSCLLSSISSLPLSPPPSRLASPFTLPPILLLFCLPYAILVSLSFPLFSPSLYSLLFPTFDSRPFSLLFPLPFFHFLLYYFALLIPPFRSSVFPSIHLHSSPFFSGISFFSSFPLYLPSVPFLPPSLTPPIYPFLCLPFPPLSLCRYALLCPSFLLLNILPTRS